MNRIMRTSRRGGTFKQSLPSSNQDIKSLRSIYIVNMHFVHLLSIIILAIVGVASAATLEKRTVDDAEVREPSASNAK